MKIAIFEIGNYHDYPDIVRIFSSVEKAIKNIPAGFKEKQDFPFDHYTEKDWEDFQIAQAEEVIL